MKMREMFGYTLGLLLLLSFTTYGQDKSKTKSNGDFQYVGAKACKACHLTAKTGAAFKIWEASPHAKAFEVLASPEAVKIAKAKGIEDPQKADACLKCHDTAHGVAAAKLASTFKPGEGVGCEVCHGPGSAYKSMKVMQDLVAGKIKPETVGLILPGEAQCKTCHNEESPTFKAFDYKTSYAKIAHEKPKAAK